MLGKLGRVGGQALKIRRQGPPPAVTRGVGVDVLIVHPQALLRQALCTLVGSWSGTGAVAQAGSLHEALEIATHLCPGIVVVDDQLPGTSSGAAIATIRRRVKTAGIIVLLERPERALQIIRAGASGCIHYGAAAGELREAVRAVAGGGTFVSSAIVQTLVRKQDQPAPSVDVLSPREDQVLRMSAAGLGNQRIAAELGLSVKTVEAHKAHVAHKLGIRGSVELLKYAIRSGLATLEQEHGPPASADRAPSRLVPEPV
jgi:DNA-binding NarL/FixJ family response regulator